MTSTDLLASSSESWDPDWSDFRSSAAKSLAPSDDQQHAPESPSRILPEGFIDFDLEPEPDVVHETEATPTASDLSTLGSGPASQKWIPRETDHREASLTQCAQPNP